MNTISGLLRPRDGQVTFLGERIDGRPPHEIVATGVAHVLERRRLFPFLTVRDNLLLGAHTLSGGEQQMVAIARGLMARPRRHAVLQHAGRAADSGRSGPPAVPRDPTGALVAAHRARGLVIDGWTGCPAWLGERLDLGWAIAVLHPAATDDCCS
jgi:ABC-type hemin transport system ATPase subunit